MADHAEGDFEVTVRDDLISVNCRGTCFAALYRKPKQHGALRATGFSKDANATSAQVAGFLSVALQLANDKAKEIGWIV